MSKLNQLKGVAHNLASSFVSSINDKFLKHIESLMNEKTTFDINLLDEVIMPKELNSVLTRKTITKYKKWFLSEIKKLRIELKDIQKVLIKITYHLDSAPFELGGKTMRHYVCTTVIVTNDKEYAEKVTSSFS